MPKYKQAEEIKKKLEGAGEVLVVLPAVPQIDQVAAGLGLQLALEKAGKKVTGVAPREMLVEFSNLVGVDRVTTKLGNKNLVISWPHAGDTIEKISYHVDEEKGKFNIVVEPRAGHETVDHEKVSMDYQGVRADMVFLVGAKQPDDLGDLVSELTELIDSKAELVRVDTRPHGEHGKAVDVIDEQVSSLSELMFQLLSDLELMVDADVATNVLHGIYQRTGNLGNPMLAAETFEVVAQLMRAGGRRPAFAQGYGEAKPGVSMLGYQEYRENQVGEKMSEESGSSVPPFAKATGGKSSTSVDQVEEKKVEDSESGEASTSVDQEDQVAEGRGVPEPFAGDLGASSSDASEDKEVQVPEPWLQEPKVYSGQQVKTD